MDSNIVDKIKSTVTNILDSSDIDSVTEQQVRQLASQQLNLDLSDLPQKILVRQIIESFLLAIPDSPQDDVVLPTAIDGFHNDTQTTVAEEQDIKPVIKEIFPDSCRVICKLSQTRDVAVRSSERGTVVSIRDLSFKDGKTNPLPKCSLFPDQWEIFRKSFPAVEEAIAKVESELRSKVEKKQPDDKLDLSANKSEKNGGRPSGGEPINLVAASHKPRLVPIEIIRFDGKNYHQWADCMESYLNQLKVAYVLSEPCPSAVGVADKELCQTLSAAERWMDDDHICRQNILNSLCDNLLGLYSKKPGTAKDLWEELKLTYLLEEHGTKVSLVKKYIGFQIVQEKSVFDQVHEFNEIADKLAASGMYVEERFHVNVILSKLPPSWKPFCIQLLKDDYLPIWMLMDHLKSEEESCLRGNKSRAYAPRVDAPVFQPSRKLGPQRNPMKKPGIPRVNHEADWDKRVRFCNTCKKRGHYPEDCWFRNTGGKNTSNEKGNDQSANAFSGTDTIENAGQS
ncbi:uncharacterized protein LOC130809630 [Amaranthus tricolor]|uniref:uncharacterized protein LOC130809630 n=1 Tax=Amaranthus tricolor TaxID=29722 RepID=UPI00258F7167|nr:uncharacterized protein LOC130809630 [Amaranthus tricolor]